MHAFLQNTGMPVVLQSPPGPGSVVVRQLALAELSVNKAAAANAKGANRASGDAEENGLCVVFKGKESRVYRTWALPYSHAVWLRPAIFS